MGTKETILDVAKEEFLAKGYRDASLRQIATKSGATTGAIYGYFEDKNTLFKAIVEDDVKALKDLSNHVASKYMDNNNIKNLFDHFSDFSHYGKYLIEEQMTFFKFLYEHRDKLIMVLFKSQGSSYENILKEYVREDAKNTIDIYKKLKNIQEVDIYTKRILELTVENSIMTLATIFRENKTFEEASPYLETMAIYYLNSFISFIKFNKE